jgi:hypothetical protein
LSQAADGCGVAELLEGLPHDVLHGGVGDAGGFGNLLAGVRAGRSSSGGKQSLETLVIKDEGAGA